MSQASRLTGLVTPDTGQAGLHCPVHHTGRRFGHDGAAQVGGHLPMPVQPLPGSACAPRHRRSCGRACSAWNSTTSVHSALLRGRSAGGDRGVWVRDSQSGWRGGLQVGCRKPTVDRDTLPALMGGHDHSDPDQRPIRESATRDPAGIDVVLVGAVGVPAGRVPVSGPLVKVDSALLVDDVDALLAVDVDNVVQFFACKPLVLDRCPTSAASSTHGQDR
jgi:hypothetical protein